MSEGSKRDEGSARRIRERTAESTAAIHSSEPAAFLLAYYEYHGDEQLACPRCGWSGLARDGSQELHRELFDVSCPSCDKMLLVVSFPTSEETRQAAAAGNPEAIGELPRLDEREARQARAKSLALKPDSELPQLEGDSLHFTWDLEEAGEEHWTVIRYEERVIWRELAYWEGWERFTTVKDILKSRYGDRFASLGPTVASELYLYGDDLTASSKLETR
jgi:hypothetical protein